MATTNVFSYKPMATTNVFTYKTNGYNKYIP